MPDVLVGWLCIVGLALTFGCTFLYMFGAFGDHRKHRSPIGWITSHCSECGRSGLTKKGFIYHEKDLWERIVTPVKFYCRKCKTPYEFQEAVTNDE